MYRKRNGSLGFSFTRFANAAVPNLFGDVNASRTGELTAFRRDMCYMHQVSSADPYALDERSFYVAGVADTENVSKKVHKALKKHEVLRSSDGTVDTYKVGPRFTHQMALLSINRQRDLIGLLFWWEEECQRLRKLDAEERELDALIQESEHNVTRGDAAADADDTTLGAKVKLDELKFARERVRMKKRQRPSQRDPAVEADRDDILGAFHGRSNSVPLIPSQPAAMLEHSRTTSTVGERPPQYFAG